MQKPKGVFIQLPLPETYKKVEGEVRLWRSFLDQMINDSFGGEVHEESREWLYDRDGSFYPDFFLVCELAQVEVRWVDYVLDKLENEYNG